MAGKPMGRQGNLHCGRRVLLALLAALLPLVAAADPPRPTALRELRIARYDTGGALPPTAQLIERAVRGTGLEPVGVEIPLARALAETDIGRIVDADPARTEEAARRYANVMLVDEPVYRLRYGAFIRRGNQPVKGWQDLRRRRVIVYEGSVVLDRLVREHSLTAVNRASTYTRAALMLSIGRGDVAILPLDETRRILAQYHLGFLEQSGPVLAEVPLYIVLNRRHAQLAPRLAESLRREKARLPAGPEP